MEKDGTVSLEVSTTRKGRNDYYTFKLAIVFIFIVCPLISHEFRVIWACGDNSIFHTGVYLIFFK